MSPSPTKRMLLVALVVLFSDQITKILILTFLGYGHEWSVLGGFLRIVCWGNTGAAWSMFYGNNKFLAGLAFFALIAIYLNRKHFDFHTAGGQIALGLMSGGILGNLVDRIHEGHVVDFIYFYLRQRGGDELGFPAFNLADVAICTGVGLVFLFAWHSDRVFGSESPRLEI